MQIRGDSIRLVRGVFDVRAAQVAEHAGRSRPWMIQVESTPELTPYVARQAIGGLFAAVLENLDREARGNPMDRREPHAQVRPGVRSVRARRHSRGYPCARSGLRWRPVRAREAALGYSIGYGIGYPGVRSVRARRHRVQAGSHVYTGRLTRQIRHLKEGVVRAVRWTLRP